MRAYGLRRGALAFVDDAFHQPRQARWHVDGGIVAACGELAAQHDVTVEYAAQLVRDRLFEIVALDQHGVERGDRAVARPCPRARPAAAARRTRSADSRGEPGLRRRPDRRRARRAQSASRCPSAAARACLDRESPRRSRSPRMRHFTRTSGGASLVAHTTTPRATPALAERVFQELAQLATALADQAHHEHVGVGLARDLAEQAALADAAAREEPDALAFAERDQARRARARRSADVAARGLGASGWARAPSRAARSPLSAGPPSSGRPSPSSTRPSSVRLRTPPSARCCAGRTDSSGPRPSAWPSGSSVAACRGSRRPRPAAGRGRGARSRPARRARMPGMSAESASPTTERRRPSVATVSVPASVSSKRARSSVMLVTRICRSLEQGA